MRGEGLAGLHSSCASPSGLGTDCCPRSTGSCVGKASCRGDDAVTAPRWHPGAPGQDRHPGSGLSSSKILRPREGTGSHRGRSQGRHCAAAESEQRAIFGVLPFLHPLGTACPGPGHHGNGGGTMEGYGNKLRSPTCPPLNCPVLFMGIVHPNTSYTPWIRTVLPCSPTAAGDATCTHVGVRNPSRPSTAAALLGQAPRARILTPRLRGRLCLLVSKPGPFPQREHGQGITRNSQIWVFPGWAGVGGGGHPHRQSLPVLHRGERCHGRTAREARAEQSRGADTGGCSSFGGCRGGASPCPERAQWVLCVGAGDLEGTGGPR